MRVPLALSSFSSVLSVYDYLVLLVLLLLFPLLALLYILSAARFTPQTYHFVALSPPSVVRVDAYNTQNSYWKKLYTHTHIFVCIYVADRTSHFETREQMQDRPSVPSDSTKRS